MNRVIDSSSIREVVQRVLKARRTWIGAGLVVALAAAVLFVTTVSTTGRICALVGADSSVGVRVLGSDPTIPTTGHARVCNEDGCDTAEIRFLQDCTKKNGEPSCRRIPGRSDLDGIAIVPDLPSGTLKVTTTIEQAGVTRTHTSTVKTKTYAPNGEHCEPVVNQATVTVPAAS
jgi:hypothetical protein